MSEGTETIVITGAAGSIGTRLAPRLTRPGRSIRLVDERETAAVEGAEVLTASVLDPDALAVAFAGADAVLHFAGIPTEAPWAELVETNLTGTQRVLEAAVVARVGSVLLASSTHAAGAIPIRDLGSGIPLPVPDSLYGVTKAGMEALGALYAERFGIGVVSARIGAFLDEPAPGRRMGTWLSPDDLARLCDAAIEHRRGHAVVWAVSANRTGWFDLAPGRAIGYEPLDDAFAVAEQLGIDPGEQDVDDRTGGEEFFTAPLGRRMA